MNTTIREIKKFKATEQLLLLLCRATISEDEECYIKELIDKPDFDWDSFLGLAFNNRVNGVVYTNIIKFNHIPGETLRFLKLSFLAQKERAIIHQAEISKIYNAFECENINYSFLKGSVLNTLLYDIGERISNDTDIMVAVKDLNKCVGVLEDLGYIQGDFDKKSGEIIPATKKEKIFARINTYEIVPLLKKIDNQFFQVHEVDINFKLSNDAVFKNSEKILENSVVLENEDRSIRTLSVENFLIFLCVHLYREATMIFKIVRGGDLNLYKFMDIHFYLIKRGSAVDWDIVLNNCNDLNSEKDVYYTLFYTEKLFPGTISEDILNKLKPQNVEYLNEYRGKDNSDEVYKWKCDFYDRVFNPTRKIEALSNIKEENERYKKITEQLKSK